MRKKRNQMIINTILLILSIVWLFPIAFVIINLFKTKQEYNMGSFWAMPEANHFIENLKYLEKAAPIVEGLISSMLYSVCGALFALVIATLAAYGLSHLNIKHKMFWFMLIYSGTVFPFQLYLIPIFKIYTKTGLYDSRIGMILFYTAICIPYVMFVMRNFFSGISNEICESAKIDGAADRTILARIFVPMSKAPLAVCFLSQFTWCWNDLMFGLTFTKSKALRPVMATISIMNDGDKPVIFMACLLASIPTLLIYIFLHKHMEQGFAYTSK